MSKDASLLAARANLPSIAIEVIGRALAPARAEQVASAVRDRMKAADVTLDEDADAGGGALDLSGVLDALHATCRVLAVPQPDEG